MSRQQFPDADLVVVDVVVVLSLRLVVLPTFLRPKMLKTVILIGGPSKGTRFRPLSLDAPKPLFPVAGFPMIYHHIEAASQVSGMKEIILIGSYQPNEALSRFITSVQHEFKILVRYLQEYMTLGTAGGMYHFRDQIQSGSPEFFFVMNCDVCGDFPLVDMLDFHRELGNPSACTVMGTEATRQQSLKFGCIVENRDTHEVLHFVEKPETFISSIINCGVYLLSPCIFEQIAVAFQKRQEEISERQFNPSISLHLNIDASEHDMTISSFEFDYNGGTRDVIRLEQDILSHIAGTGQLYVYQTSKFWSQIKSAGAAVYANRHYLAIYHRTHPDRLACNGDGKPNVIGDVFIHPTASVHPSATLGPNVTIGKNVTVGAGVRVRESIILEGVVLKDHCCILHSIVGWSSAVGEWSRVEGTPNDPNPNKPFAKLEINEVFNNDGRLNPSITVIGSKVQIPAEVIVLNSIVLPHKELNRSYKNQIIL